MTRSINILILLAVFFAVSCSSTQRLSQTPLSGEDYLTQGKYKEAFDFYENKISELEEKEKDIDGKIYRNAGSAAFKIGEISKAIAYFERAKYLNSHTDEMLVMLIDSYRYIDNLSKEIMALEDYIEKYPAGKEIANIKARLFETCLESENWELAEKLWTDFGEDAEKDSTLLDIYLKINIALDHKEKSDMIAPKLLNINAENTSALEYLGEKYFWKAESRYQAETSAYEKNRTRRQYAKLLKALDVVTVDFKKSLSYFKKLYTINPDKEYAKYLANIYARLDDKERSTYYKNRAR